MQRAGVDGGKAEKMGVGAPPSRKTAASIWESPREEIKEYYCCGSRVISLNLSISNRNLKKTLTL